MPIENWIFKSTKAGFRTGDDAPMAVIELVDEIQMQEKSINLKKLRLQKKQKLFPRVQLNNISCS